MAGDEVAFERLMRELTPTLTRVSFRLLGWHAQRAELEDVLQETFTRVWAARSQFRSEAKIVTWVTSITLNICRARLRRRKLWRKFVAMVPPISAQSDDGHEESCPLLMQAIRGLSPRLSEVLVLHYLEELSIPEIAELLGVRRNTIEVRLHRARQQLQQRMAKNNPEEKHETVCLQRPASCL